MKILSAAQFQELDAYTIKHDGIRSIDLMERAAVAVADAICKRWKQERPVLVFAGPGNNGGDALAVARLLSERGFAVEASLFNTNQKLSADCEANKQRLAEHPAVKFTEVTAQFEPPQITAETIIVDGLFGTGLNKSLQGGFAALVKYINASKGTVVSIDMPSGLLCEDNTLNVRSNIVRANLTLTFQLPKLAMFLADCQEFIGELEVLDIHLSESKIAALDASYEILEKRAVRSLLRPRDPFGHKGTFGHALLVAGQHGMSGAAVLAARACLRSGVGKVTVHTPQKNNDILQISVPETVLSLDKNENVFSSTITTEAFSAIGIGPGIGTGQETALAFIEQVRHARVPTVIDADGINILGDHKGWIQQIPPDSILTPHPLEFQRIGNHATDPYTTLAEAREMAVKHSFFIILKGHFTAICQPDGKTYFNPTGNSGMATAGSGDVLTGIITSLLAQHYSVREACQLGVFLHGLAGDIAAARHGEEAMMASDIIEALPEAFKCLRDRD